jgi:pimeloyl-ACP methyl ester carboxylesterase
MPKEFVETLSRKYEGRVFAFDHFTLSNDPKQNVNWLLEHLPDGTALDLDIVCHSRGGLVSRMLSEKQRELVFGSRKLKVGKVVFVGAPNAGTILADGQHVGDLIDTYTNLLNFLPDNGVTDILEAIIAVVKQLAVGALKGLPGLQSMRPGGEFGKWLNAGPRAGETRYFALASDFTPGEPGLKAYAMDRLMDKVFTAANDLVVPTEGVFAENGSGFFPIEEKFVFKGSDGVAHTGFFGHRGAREKIMEWLSA